METSAELSEDGLYRYTLTRTWDAGAEHLLWVMLNPSTADASVDDPTIQRVMRFSQEWSFGGCVVANLYGLRATNPHQLLTSADPVGPDNDNHLRQLITRAVLESAPVIAAWGAHPFAVKREAAVYELVPGTSWKALGFTMSGAPRHPLYVRGDSQLSPYTGPDGKGL